MPLSHLNVAKLRDILILCASVNAETTKAGKRMLPADGRSNTPSNTQGCGPQIRGRDDFWERCHVGMLWSAPRSRCLLVALVFLHRKPMRAGKCWRPITSILNIQTFKYYHVLFIEGLPGLSNTKLPFAFNSTRSVNTPENKLFTFPRFICQELKLKPHLDRKGFFCCS